MSLDEVSVDGYWWNFQESIFTILSNIWHHQKSRQEPPCPPRLQEETWRTGWVLMGFLLSDLDEIFRNASLLYCLTYDTIKKSSGTSMSSKTPGRDLEDRVSLDGLSLIRFWWNFQESFSMIISNKLQTPKHYQEPPCPPRLQEETWRTGWVWTGFFWSDFGVIFRKASLW